MMQVNDITLDIKCFGVVHLRKCANAEENNREYVCAFEYPPNEIVPRVLARIECAEIGDKCSFAVADKLLRCLAVKRDVPCANTAELNSIAWTLTLLSLGGKVHREW